MNVSLRSVLGFRFDSEEPIAGFNARHDAWSKETLENIATMEANGELAPLPER